MRVSKANARRTYLLHGSGSGRDLCSTQNEDLQGTYATPQVAPEILDFGCQEASEPSTMSNKIERAAPTKSKHPLVWHVLAATDHISGMALTHLIITDIKPFHPFFFQGLQDVCHFLGTV